ncbi:MAG: hypothetical protein NQU42_05300 [Methanothrix sp.]|uniref:hypothetical protein n=1 Tax=Methanothrix sp. TaxID=90426 RepID=UPI0025CE931D|nr:hypothetical protein [Methanothrix sp.]MCQ8903489.1 hypothetical protein [Methanothrix sp.]
MRYIALMLVFMIPLASAYHGGNSVSQSIDMSASGGYVSQSASNAAVVVGDNNNLNQKISQSASGNYVTQSAANAAVVIGNSNTVGQSTSQSANGNTISQSAANAVAVVGDLNTVNQRVSQSATGNEIYQSGWNTATIVGDGNILTQQVMQTINMLPAHVDPSQTMSNSAYIMGSYNTVDQGLYGTILAGTNNAPMYQSGRNYIQTNDPTGNSYSQRIRFSVRAGPRAPVSQSGQNEIRIGPL